MLIWKSIFPSILKEIILNFFWSFWYRYFFNFERKSFGVFENNCLYFSWAKKKRIKWNEKRKKRGKYWKKNKCYYCRCDNISNLQEHRKTCNKFLTLEKRSKRIARQKYFGKKKKKIKTKKATKKKRKKNSSKK